MISEETRKPNISRVARLAGVSKMTVSRVINGNSAVAPDTRERVLQAVEQLRFRPNLLARSLAGSRTRILGLQFHEDAAPNPRFFYDILLGAQYEAHVQGYDLLFFSQPPSREDPRSAIRFDLVEGVICTGGTFNMNSIEFMEQERLPYVIVGRRDWKQFSPYFCAPDYVTGYQEATSYLLDMGHRRIAFCGGKAHFEADIDKREGYLRAFEAHGLAPDPTLILMDEPGRERASQTEAFLLEKRPTAVISHGDEVWNLVKSAARKGKFSIPGDLSVLCFGLSEGMQMLGASRGYAPLTRLEAPVFEMGRQSAKMLISWLDGEEMKQRGIFLPLDFIKGDSCVPPRSPQK